MIETSKKLGDQIKALPKKPGVYQYFDKEDKILYVGKATSLKSRVSSYFTSIDKHSAKTRVLVSKIERLEFIIADSPYDALLLENTLIKRLQPRYNILLRDDKTYPWICIKKERFPRVFYTRNLIKDGSEYYGPYASLKAMHALLNFINRVYKLRNCKFNLSQENIEGGKFRACLEYNIGNCKAPCVGYQSEENYLRSISGIRKILKGNINEVVKDLATLMNEAASNLEFEQAQELKEQIVLLENYQLKSTVVSATINNVDVFSIVSDDKFGYVNFMKINNGAVIQAHTVEVKKKMDEKDPEILEVVIPEIRSRFNSQSREVLLSTKINLEVPDIKFNVPQRGDKLKLIEMSIRNVKYFMKDRHNKQELVDPDRRKNRILGQLQKDLRMKEMPVHIECFDNSNFQGTNAVGACVVFKDAKPSKKDYRNFNIKTVVGPDDFASMREVVYRRYKRLLDENQPLPQLIIIDGGKGQLSSALESLDELNLRGQITIIGIAKKLEEIFFPGDQIPIYIDKRSESLKLIQHLRNEAHRFGITHHRNKRSKQIKSGLVDIPGIGPKTVEKLLNKFKSVKRIKEASDAELSEVLNLKQISSIKEWANPS